MKPTITATLIWICWALGSPGQSNVVITSIQGNGTLSWTSGTHGFLATRIGQLCESCIGIGPGLYYPLISSSELVYQLLGRDTPFTNIWYDIGGPMPGTGDMIYGFERGTGPTWLPSRAWNISERTDDWSLDFDGTNDFAFHSHDPLLALTSGMTLEAWVKPSTASMGGTIIAKSASQSITVYRMGIDGTDQATFQVFNPSGVPFVDISGSSVLPAETWIHLAGTYDGSTANLYLNGIIDASTTTVGTVRTSALAPLVVGGILGNDSFSGKIDEVRLWDHARTQPEIFASHATKLEGTEPGLVGYWQSQEPSSQTTADGSPNGFDLTLGETGVTDDFDPLWCGESFPGTTSLQALFEFGTPWFSVFWDTVPGELYWLQATSDPVADPWTTVVVNIQGTGNEAEFFETPTSNTADFANFQLYRVLGPPPAAVFSFIPAGTFIMGSQTNELGRCSDEDQHEVTLTRDFFMQRTEVTNRQMADVLNWALGVGKISVTSNTVQNLEGSPQELLDLDGSWCQISWNGVQLVVDVGKEEYPCVEVTWYGAQAYCNYLSDMDGLSRAIAFSDWSMNLNAGGYRLPTESEWEYACRAGTTSAFYTGEITYTGASPLDPNLNAAGWYGGNSANPDNPMISGKGTHPVGLKQANAWGLFDTLGNVFEWTGDWLGSYPGTVTDPTGGPPGAFRVGRGGSWNDSARGCRSAFRNGFELTGSGNDLSFRPVHSSVFRPVHSSVP